MLDFQTRIKIEVDKISSTLTVGFKPQTPRPIYDICDLHGRILKTGGLTLSDTQVDLDGLRNKEYILLILDGDRIFTKKIDLRLAS
ncbi:MAG: hypothetical protein WBG42_09295 [Cryomorphaceae bacterium]